MPQVAAEFVRAFLSSEAGGHTPSESDLLVESLMESGILGFPAPKGSGRNRRRNP